MDRLIKKSNKQVILYHGTSSSFAEDILKNGILPEGYTGNTMFDYRDYNRKGLSKHPDSVYLTNSLLVSKNYSKNSTKKQGGFPIVLKVSVDEELLTWDDDALYRQYKDFDFGKQDIENLRWEKKPPKKLWEQSIEINKQCSHLGVVGVDRIQSIFINGKWIEVEKFKEVLKEYDNLNLHTQLINKNALLDIKDYTMSIDEEINLNVSIVGRKIYIYNLRYEKENISLSTSKKTAISIKIMQEIKNNVDEFGATIIYDNEILKIGINPKNSVFNYVFGVFKIINGEPLLEDLKKSTDELNIYHKIIRKIVYGKATEKEVKFVSSYSIDFLGDVIKFCVKVLKNNKSSLIKNLETIRDKYKSIYKIVNDKIKYLQITKHESF